MANYEDMSIQLKEALAECERLRQENAQLKRRWNMEHSGTTAPIKAAVLIENGAENFTELSPEAKVALFRQLFRGRDDVYAIRWEKRNGRSGYSPACIRNWNPIGPSNDGNGRLGKQDRDYLPLTGQVVRDHLQGKHIIGIYPLLQDETCWFLAADFDKKTWEEDVAAFMNVCRDFEVPAVLERSRSGNGGHVWIFFDRPILAVLARQMG